MTNPAFVYHKEELRFLWQWDAAAVAACSLRRRSKAEIAGLLQNKKVYFVGDSHVRYFHNTLLPTLGGGCAGALAGGEHPLLRCRTWPPPLSATAGEQLPKGEKPPYKAQSLPGSITTRINVTSVAGMVRDVILSWCARRACQPAASLPTLPSPSPPPQLLPACLPNFLGSTVLEAGCFAWL